jgi:hypothetical protein
MVPRMEANTTESDYVSNITYLNLAKNKIHYFPFKEYVSSLTDSCSTSIKFCKLDLKGNCLSVLDDESVNALGKSAAVVELSDNPWSCECSDSSESVYRMLSDNRTLECATPEYLKGKSCIGVKHDCHSATSTSGTDSSLANEADANLEENGGEKPKLGTNSESEPFRASVLIFIIYIILVLVAVVIVLGIIRAVGKPEPDEYWWEDKLAKRNY